MKKIISILMVICLVAGLLPTVFAADTTTGVKIVYDIGGRAPGWGTTGVDFSSFDYAATNNLWEYYNNSYGQTTAGTNIKWRGPGGIQLIGTGWYAVKINVPVSGTYRADVKYAKFKSTGGMGTAIVLPTTTDLATFDPNVWANIKDKVFCSIDCRNGASDAAWSDANGDFVASSGMNIHLDAGEYYLCYYYSKSGSNFAFGDFTLYTVNDDGTNYADYSSVYTGKVTFADAEEDGNLAVGETTTVVATLGDSVTHSAITDITYTSSDENVATVSADGTVTAKAPGTATISAKADGYVAGSASGIEITVNRPADAAVGTKIVYDIGSYMGGWGDTSVLFSGMTYEKTGGVWEYHSNSANVTTIDSINFKYFGPRGLQFGNGAWFAMKVNIPVSGKYRGELYHGKIKSGGGTTRVYILPTDIDIASVISSASSAEVLGDAVCSGGTASSYTWDADGEPIFTRLQNTRNLTAGEYYLVYRHYKGTHSTAGNLVLYSVDEDGNDYGYYDPAYMGIASPETAELAPGESVTVSAMVSDSITGAAVTDIKYTSSDESVAKVDAMTGKVIAMAPGKAVISATSAAYKAGGVLGCEVTVNAPKAKDKVSFVVAKNVNDADVTVESDDFAYNGAVDSVLRGSKVTLIANPLEGYNFIGWKRGSNSEYASYISTEEAYETTLCTNTYITAMYTAIEDEKEVVVEYYNQNGEYISTLAPDEAAPIPGKIVGFTFGGEWFTDIDKPLDITNITKRTRAVAKHNPKALAGIVTVNGVASVETAFDSAITSVASGSFTCWKRDGKVVSYNPDYTYYIWDTTAIVQSDEAVPTGKKLPVVILDDDKVDGAYMIEYDAADYEIVEVGILFNDASDEAPTVDSCTKKFTSQRKLTHGQMSAADCDNVRGYLIYKDGNDYRVIYTD